MSVCGPSGHTTPGWNDPRRKRNGPSVLEDHPDHDAAHQTPSIVAERKEEQPLERKLSGGSSPRPGRGLSHACRNLRGRSRTSSSLFSALFTEKGPFPTSVAASTHPYPPSALLLLLLRSLLHQIQKRKRNSFLLPAALFASSPSTTWRNSCDLRSSAPRSRSLAGSHCLRLPRGAELFAEIWILGIRTCSRWAWVPSGLSGMSGTALR